ncbi:MAG TPA: MFS transporter [Vicinamibacterales bacterium]|nr:MFS transporter [Vicinamibacterales bacterium]
MSPMQVVVVGLTIALNALDGFDILSISFASPGISSEWKIDGARLGTVLSMELLGMAIGSVFLGGVADKLGRRKTMLGCLVVMASGMFLATTAQGLVALSVWRVLTGLGIGGMLAAINAVAAEFSSTRRRDLSVALMSIGYPLGAVFGGMVAARLLRTYDWRSVFYLGAGATTVLIPLVFFFIPESVHWLAQKQPAGALQQINRTLARMGHAAISALPVLSADARKRSIGDILGPGLVGITVLVTIAYFLHIMTFYFILKWVPKIVVNFGFPSSSAAGVLVWVNVGGATGGAILGFLAQRYSVKGLTVGAMVLSSVMVMIFGQTSPDLAQMSMICAGAGFFTNGAIVGMYALFARAFPTHVRASGTGFAIGIGRGGSWLAPPLAGLLFDGSVGLPIVAFVMSLGSLMAALVLSLLKLGPERRDETPVRSDVRTGLKGAPAAS